MDGGKAYLFQEEKLESERDERDASLKTGAVKQSVKQNASHEPRVCSSLPRADMWDLVVLFFIYSFICLFGCSGSSLLCTGAL